MEYSAEQERMEELGYEDDHESEVIKELIKDEYEAVDAYEKAIAELEVEDKVIEVLKHILEEEKQHIVELEKILHGEPEILE